MTSMDEAARAEALRRYEILNTPPEPQFDRITRMASTVLGRPVSTLALADRDRFWFKSRHGVAATEMPRSMAFCEETIASESVFIVEDALLDARFADAPVVKSAPNFRFYAGAPLVTPRGVRIGSLCVLDFLSNSAFSERDRVVLADLAATAIDIFEARARQIEFTRSTEEIAHLARHDALTGLPNRTRLAELYAAAQSQARGRGHGLALLYLDLDGFKPINDHHGHDRGDALLREVAARLRAGLPPEASVARIGGDEFVVLLSGPADLLCDRAQDLALKLIDSLGIPYHGLVPGFAVGCSIGVVVTEAETRLAQLMSRADSALYSAKSQGRGRYVMAEVPARALCG